MVSDGVLDHLHVKDAREAMTDILRSLDTKNPDQMAKQILERICSLQGDRQKMI